MDHAVRNQTDADGSTEQNTVVGFTAKVFGTAGHKSGIGLSGHRGGPEFARLM